MSETDKDLVRRTLEALTFRFDEKEFEKQIEKMPKELIEELAANIRQVFRDWAYENDYIKREDLDQICAEMASERRNMMQEARD